MAMLATAEVLEVSFSGSGGSAALVVGVETVSGTVGPMSPT